MTLGTSGSNAPDNLRGYCRWLTNTSTDFTETQIDGLLNRWYHLFINEILDSIDHWDVQGETATADLVADQREYTLPTDIITLKKVQLKIDGTNWIEGGMLDVSETQVAMSDETAIVNNFSSTKPYISVLDNSIFVWSDTITAVIGGIKLWYSKEASILATDSDQPNIAEAYQKGLCYGVAMDYFDRVGNIQKAREMKSRLYGGNVGDRQSTVIGVIPSMKAHYGKRTEEKIIVRGLNEDYS